VSTFKKDLGKFGEKLACDYLEEKGYAIIEKNFYTRGGEIDIIAKDGNILVFVEVKTRTSLVFGPPEEAIDFSKQRKLAKTIEFYLLKNNFYNQSYRVDSIAIEIDKERKKAKIRHEKNIL